MLRALWFFAAIGAIAAAIVWLADNPGDVLIRWFDYEAETSVGLLVFIGALFGVAAVAAYRIGDLVSRGPKAFMRQRVERRRSRGLDHLTRGFAAAAIGDATAARKYLTEARTTDDAQGLTELLAARVAELDGDEASAEVSYRALLASPNTEFLGLRGLYETAIRQGDTLAALEFATRAFQLNPKSAWVANSLLRVQAQTGAFDLARKTIAAARRSGIFSGADARRREGVLTAAQALAAAGAGEEARAAERAKAALALAPGIVPMAILTAKAQAAAGQQWSAAGTLEAAWRLHPHPDIAEAYRGLKPDESAEARSRRLIGLAEFKPDHLESHLLIAAEALQLGESRRALRALRPHLELPTARVAMMMGEIEARRGRTAEAGEWRRRAVRAPRDAQWTCTECGRDREDWAPFCDGCGGFDTFAWGPAGAFGGASLVSLPPEALPSDADLEETPTPPGQEAQTARASGPPPVPLAASRPENREDAAFVPPRPPDDPGPDIDDRRLFAPL